MHTSFTGSARKPRQVNLSGRNVGSAWPSLSGSNKPPSSASGTHNALAQAQADRIKRQQERDKAIAARKIQKTWRGHACRTVQKQQWREEWDRRETKRLKLDTDIDFTKDANIYPVIPYADTTIWSDQMGLLVRFLDVVQETDSRRLLYFGDAFEASLQHLPVDSTDPNWVKSMEKFGAVVAKSIQHVTQIKVPEIKGVKAARYLRLGALIAKAKPEAVCRSSLQHFQALRSLLSVSDTEPAIQEGIAEYAIAILSGITTDVEGTYSNFANQMLTSPYVGGSKKLLEFLRQRQQQLIITQALIPQIQSEIDHGIAEGVKVEGRLWNLAYLIFLRGDAEIRNTGVQDDGFFRDWLKAVSLLISECADEIAARIDEIDQPMDGSNTFQPAPLHFFIKKQVLSLAQQSSIAQIMDELKRLGSPTDPVLAMAKPLANYAVALLRAFPSRATNIRMWLYRGSPSLTRQSTSTIQYLWQASESTAVFRKIKGQKNVISVLLEAAPEHNQIGRAQVSKAEIAAWQEEWRILLLFLELYTFILKLMDDQEFFALDERNKLNISDQSYSNLQQGALPLQDIAKLTTFLKNLAFPLYWNAGDLDESNEIEESGGLAVLFGTAPIDRSPTVTEKNKPHTLAGNGVSQAYLKGLVTGLLRMLHERDSRRRFLPTGHWLMTSQFDMQGFIPAVVAEEQRRHEVGEDEEEFEAYTTDVDAVDGANAEEPDSVLPSLTAMFGIRPPHTPRSQTSRYAEQLRKRRDVARRKRQSESLAPRLEILRNLPFFIPFETRVQIFREFIYRDQIRRRNGYIDADQWRMSVAASTQGRGLDGRPHGLDLIGRHHADIRRGKVFQDAYKQFYDLGEELKEPIQISFIDQFGSQEAGIDGGGVTKEFLISVTSEAFDPGSDLQMFVENDEHYLYPNPNMYEAAAETLRLNGQKRGSEEYETYMRELLRRYEFLGRVIGKCLYEGILVDIVFAGFFLLKWSLTGGTTSATNETGYRASINDLRDFDEALYKGLLKLKNYPGDVESDFGLNFTVNDDLRLLGIDQTVTKDLMPNGSNTAVTNANRLVYIDRITRYRLQQQPARVTNAFLKGLGQIIQPMWLAMFNQRELQNLVGGDNAELDIADLRRNTQYGGLYVIGDDGLEHPTVALFWKVLKDMSDEDRRKVLKFVTSTPRAPLLGFGHLNPKFSIRDSSEDQSRLPSTSTCVNLLKLPRYGNEQTMKEKLLYAVNSGAGFDLS